jgi:cytochrome c553
MKRKLFFTAAVLSGTISGIVVAAPTKVLTLNGSKSAVAAAKPAEAAKAPQLSKAQSDFFEAKVRPVLAASCFKCHSTEGGKVKGGLLLDSREGWMKGGENGAVIVPGDPTKSRLITAINYTDGDLQMPPKGEKLSPNEIADLTTWVKMGAPDPRTSAAGSKLTGLNDKAKAHWAYQPVRRPAVPQVKDASWVRSPVDAFVLAKLEQNGMTPSPVATKESLIRRATYDLIGLPPTPEEVEAFVSDTSPTAFAKVVDRLLASPHYGERWGRFWLDSARYSDTTGIEGNARNQEYRYAHAWTYRDYVIRAFNEDKPYDQFLMEQIAADKLPVTERDPSRLAALGFITVGKRFQNPNDVIDERIDALSKTTMGLTVACARCHDHKFDPIPTADYYSLHGIFASTVEPGMGGNGKYGNKMESGAMAAADAAEAKAAKMLASAGSNNPDFADYQQKRAAIEQKNRDAYYDMVLQKGDEFRKNAAGYVLIGMYGRKGDRDDLITRNKLIAEFGLDREIYQQFRLRPAEAAVFGPALKFAELPAAQIPVKARELLADIATGKLTGGGKFGRITVNPLVIAAFRNVSPESIKTLRDVTAIYGKLFADIEPQAKAYVQANRTATSAEVKGFDPSLVDLIQIPAPVHSVVEIADGDRLRSFIQELPQQNGAAYRKFSFTELNELDLTHPGAPAMPMIVTDAPVPHNSPIFIRGEAQNRGPIVPRQFLEILAGPNRKPFTIGSGRLELAQAIASKSNPLTARVMINRIWLHHFGEAFVRTPDDLGVQSETPSHPELLDYLASRFMQEGWSIKQMHRLIMLSSTYQQTSDTNLKYADKDPANRLLWRANLRRLDFEAIRDTMVQFTGKADLTVGGKPVNLTEEPYSNRRSVYGYIDRGNLPELMAQFDFSDPDMTNSKRTSTIVPQQALFFMNSPMSVDVARKVASRPEFMAATDDAGRVKAIYEVLYQRAPRPEEIAFAMDFVSEEKDNGEAQPNSAVADGRKTPGKFARKFQKANGGGKYADSRRPVQNRGDYVERKALSAWELYTQALLFTNELAYVN